MSALPHDPPPLAVVAPGATTKLRLADVVTEAERLHTETRSAVVSNLEVSSAERREILGSIHRLEARMNERDAADGFAAADLRTEVAELREALPMDGVFAEIAETLARVEQFLGGVVTTSAERMTLL